jgi:hypothetical protein
MSLYTSLFISLLGGFSAKVYDDLNDNNILQKFRNNTFMEFLKGIHFISFTTISIEEPLFFIISYVANLLHHFGNDDAFSEFYEHSLLYSFLLLFIIVDYRKIRGISLLDVLLLIGLCSSMFFEPVIMYYFFENSEFSFQKLIIRIFYLITSILYLFFSTSNASKYLFSYFIGYFIFSIFVQYYSLETIKKEKEEKKEKEKGKKKKDKKNKNTNSKNKKKN